MSTGLLLGVLLLHLIPDAAADMKTGLNGIRKLTSRVKFWTKKTQSDFATNYPWSYFLIGIGFFIIAIVELIVNRHQSRRYYEQIDLQDEPGIGKIYAFKSVDFVLFCFIWRTL